MKALITILLLIVVVGCSKKSQDEIMVTNLDQIAGTWRWEGSCGGFSGACVYSSNAHYSELLLSKSGQYVLMNNDTIYETATYTINKTDNTTGSIILDNIISPTISSNHIQYSISINNNKLIITRGEFFGTYKKIR